MGLLAALVVEFGASFAGVATRAALDLGTTTYSGSLVGVVAAEFQRSFVPFFLVGMIVVLIWPREPLPLTCLSVVVPLVTGALNPGFSAGSAVESLGAVFGFNIGRGTQMFWVAIFAYLPLSIVAATILYRILRARANDAGAPPPVSSWVVAAIVAIAIGLVAGTCEANASGPVGRPAASAIVKV